MNPDFKKGNGLLPTVVTDANTKEVLMVAWMNEESFKKTKETKETWFWSRSRQELWHKGGTSGNVQRVVRMALDCDLDTLLVEVIPNGPACHTGATSCFFNEIPLEK
ncbi:phosphoribosyl-AMP cyclohydrolase [Veillonella sp. YH-vei2232]|jgi:phosphoribosyl-AMP cyclohydrolase|uniref:Phosphoribosyl-AMP cyclohydrolase n=1 Tax=Veillonella absiana TaxID=3079305 RepID=A0ABU3Z7Y1_9FIRM|nr:MULTISPECIES: phosphoribosyl-AMP cyclohydrolase [unclassified Veillonella]MBP6923156.1 phosphoribosyl-AMP cyclohydrolase [Veillonella sp.]MBP8616001.1 phosphoribosyl-AMP cyclohydrolase [Veillonella sp.]MBP9516809.1 phosphoribosyl-AMP cyclohydrolase [Veillonella sp.]MBP9550936.1 phosphoribosyl-AMP cyclohydrolase [Veillonella sp.]MDV5062605.1 phosphoribosyl-AMP cyclohydrolase [Veillonella sp. YH-vei2232]